MSKEIDPRQLEFTIDGQIAVRGIENLYDFQSLAIEKIDAWVVGASVSNLRTICSCFHALWMQLETSGESAQTTLVVPTPNGTIIDFELAIVVHGTPHRHFVAPSFK